MTEELKHSPRHKHAVRVTAQEAAYEIEGMRAVPDHGIPWAQRLKGPHPPAVCRAAGAINVLTTSYTQQYMIAYLLADANLLVNTPYRSCVECGQAYSTEQELIDAYNAGRGDLGEEAKDGVSIIFCPACMHDWPTEEHIIQLTDHGFTIQHPLSCRPNLFDCLVAIGATVQLATKPDLPSGQYVCGLANDGTFAIGEPLTSAKPPAPYTTPDDAFPEERP